MDNEMRERIARSAGRTIVGVERVVGGGYTPAGRWRVRFAEGESWFAKIGTTPLTAGWVRDEARWYEALAKTRLADDLLPHFRGLLDHEERPALLLEDLSGARWPPPWAPGDLARVLAAVARMASVRPLPSDLPPIGRDAGWREVERDRGPFLSLGLCSEAWLARALPVLIAAQEEAPIDGDDLVHRDLRSDNLCFVGDRVVLVDWNMPARGNSTYDRAFFAPSSRLEGGLSPEEIVPDDASWAALVSGFFASRAGLPTIPDAPRVRTIQRRQLAIALPWAVRALGLPAPDEMPARRALVQLDTALAQGTLSEADWHRETEEVLVDAYLASTDPRAMSGKSGDEIEWRWSRELVLDAVTGSHAEILDVGCANGYLMDSLSRWGAERGLRIEPYGLEISERLARLAQRQHPQWASRIWVGNVMDWALTRRFDIVHTGLDYVPPAQRRALVERILGLLLRPGGRLVIRAERASESDPVGQLAAIGIDPGGVLEAAHPTTGALRRTAWIEAR